MGVAGTTGAVREKGGTAADVSEHSAAGESAIESKGNFRIVGLGASAGTLGLGAAGGAGGLCRVQDPAEAKFTGMPDSTIKSGCVTRMLAVDQRSQALRDGTRQQPIRRVAVAPTPAAVGGLGRILMLLQSATGHDFSQYKKSILGRSIERRMAQHSIEETEAYARFLEENPAELQMLFRELLINVTSFFRDPPAFAALKADILPALLAGKPDNHVLRVWVAGCATGEETYSIAMLLRELMDESHHEFKVQLYSTDLDDDAIATARAGFYPPNIAQDVTPERLRRFFTKEDGGYRIKKEIREMAVFAVQSVVKDPPFTQLDLLACRNLLIYLEPELQNRLIPTFHYAIRPGGVLFLSPSESIGNHTDLFEPIDRTWKLYRAKSSVASIHTELSKGLSWAQSGDEPAVPDRRPSARVPHFAELASHSLQQNFAPAAVAVEQVLHVVLHALHLLDLDLQFDIRSELQGGDLLPDAQSVLDSRVPVEHEVCTASGTWCLARIQPYRTADKVIDGSAQATMSRRCFEIADGRWDFPALRELLETVLPHERSFELPPIEHDFPGHGVRRLQVSARRIIEPAGNGELVLLVIETAGAKQG